MTEPKSKTPFCDKHRGSYTSVFLRDAKPCDFVPVDKVRSLEELKNQLLCALERAHLRLQEKEGLYEPMIKAALRAAKEFDQS